MLARRFTLVCLLIAAFGMSFAVLVAEQSRMPQPRAGLILPCDALGCTVPLLR